jgi:hypothetical protein
VTYKGGSESGTEILQDREYNKNNKLKMLPKVEPEEELVGFSPILAPITAN